MRIQILADTKMHKYIDMQPNVRGEDLQCGIPTWSLGLEFEEQEYRQPHVHIAPNSPQYILTWHVTWLAILIFLVWETFERVDGLIRFNWFWFTPAWVYISHHQLLWYMQPISHQACKWIQNSCLSIPLAEFFQLFQFRGWFAEFTLCECILWTILWMPSLF